MNERRMRTLTKPSIGQIRGNAVADGYGILVTLGVLSRLVPHPLNVTAIGALGLLAGARGQSRKGWLVPVLALLLTDLWLGGYSPITMLFVYGGFAAGAAIGRWWLRGRTEPRQIAVASIAMSTAFYFVSNFGWWLAGSDYPLTSDGLTACYVAALPWFVASMTGDLFYSLMLVGTYDWLLRRSKSPDPLPAWVRTGP